MGGGQAGKSLDEFVRGDADAGEVTAPRVVHAGGFQHVQARSARRAGLMVADELFADFAAASRVVRHHGGHDDAVAEARAADGQRREDADACQLHFSQQARGVVVQGIAQRLLGEGPPLPAFLRLFEAAHPGSCWRRGCGT